MISSTAQPPPLLLLSSQLSLTTNLPGTVVSVLDKSLHITFIHCWAVPCRPTSPIPAQLQDRQKKESCIKDRYQWFNRWGSLHTWSKVLEWHATTCRGLPAGQGCSLHSKEKWGDCQELGELMSGWLTSYQWNQQRGRPLIRTITPWAWGKYVGRFCRWGGCRLGRPWKSRG